MQVHVKAAPGVQFPGEAGLTSTGATRNPAGQLQLLFTQLHAGISTGTGVQFTLAPGTDTLLARYCAFPVGIATLEHCWYGSDAFRRTPPRRSATTKLEAFSCPSGSSLTCSSSTAPEAAPGTPTSTSALA